MEIADESRTDGSRVLPCQVEPVENAIRRVMGETCYSPQTVALAQEGQGFDHHQAWATHGLEERVLIGAKGVSTSRTVVTLFNVTEDLDVASVDCATIRTGFGVTPLPREFHDVFPPSQHDDTSNGLSWLGVPSEGFTAYVYSTGGSNGPISSKDKKLFTWPRMSEAVTSGNVAIVFSYSATC